MRCEIPTKFVQINNMKKAVKGLIMIGCVWTYEEYDCSHLVANVTQSVARRWICGHTESVLANRCACNLNFARTHSSPSSGGAKRQSHTRLATDDYRFCVSLCGLLDQSRSCTQHLHPMGSHVGKTSCVVCQNPLDEVPKPTMKGNDQLEKKRHVWAPGRSAKS